MSLVLSVFGESAYKEFVLPTASDITTTLRCRKDIYNLPADIELCLENTDGKWFYQAATAGHIVKNGKVYARPSLRAGDYFLYRDAGRTLLAIIVQNGAERFASYTKYALTGQHVQIGTDATCGLRYSYENSGFQYISGVHAIMELTPQGLLLTDHSKNGIFVNNRRVSGHTQLAFGDQIDLWGLNIVALGRILAIRETEGLTVDLRQLRLSDLAMKAVATEIPERPQYHRSPRSLARLIDGRIEIEDPPAPQNGQEQSMLTAVGPALTMVLPMVVGSVLAIVGSRSSGAYMYTGLVTSVLSGLFGTFWAIRNMRNARRQRAEYEARRISRYTEYLQNKADRIRLDYENNLRILQETYPPASQLAVGGIKGRHLWERNTRHADLLTYRLGLGDIPFQEEIQIAADKFSMFDDDLRDEPDRIRAQYQTLHDAPVCVDLRKEHIVGLVGGPDRKGARSILRNLVTQIAVLNCYTDVKLAFLYQEDQGDDADKWEYCRWLPHVWSEGHKVRYVAANREESSDVLYELAALLRDRKERAQNRPGRDVQYRPWYILVFEDSKILENEPIASYLLNQEENYGVTSLFLANTPEELPNACDCILRWDSKVSGMYHVKEQDMESGHIRMETIESERLAQLARSLSNVEVNELEVGGEIPNAISFLDMYGVSRPEELHAEDLWRRNRTYENMRAQIGQKSGGLPCYLDVHEKYHGPHGLIAGTTGSGKSETLQTYILSLTMNYSPYDVGLFIIDYKGGGMANLFQGLPHMLGAISNLSGNQIQRAMVSIKSENLRRQRIFNENGVNNINLYTMLLRNGEATIPIPHLFIIIDEFAELKREQPEFMRELISVAQVGRSLGVHLILATQKPSGTVDDNIWSNSRFRLCLRVQDRQDSMDMLHKADAAYLTQAGRGYLQVGSDEVYEQFQSGWSGAPYDAETAGTRQVLARMLASNGRTAIVGSYQQRQHKEQARINWITQLAAIYDTIAPAADGTGQSEDARIDAMYQAMRQAGIEYPESGMNTRALRNLITLLAQAGRAQVTRADRARWIVDAANRSSLRLPEHKQQTQLDAMVAYLAQTAVQQGYQPLPPLWLAPLPTFLCLQELEAWETTTYHDGAWPVYGSKWELSAMIGRADDPRNQSQFPISVNFTQGGHHVLIGAAAGGKSTLVQTLIYSLIHRYSPQYLSLYILDYSNRMTQPFLHDAHVGGILFEDDTARVGKLFYLLRTMIEERKRLFHGGNYTQYVTANGVTCPAVVLIIDNMANFREKTQEAYDDDLIRLAREGATYGIYMFLTGSAFGIADVPNRLGNLIRSTMCLSLSDVYQYGDVLRIPKPDIYPEAGVNGRGLIASESGVLEYQTALANDAEDVYQRGERIEAECRFMRQGWNGVCAREIPFIPERPTWQDVMARSETAELLAGNRYLPIGYDYATAGIYAIDLRYTYCYTVQGRVRTGKTNALKICMHAAQAGGMRLSVIETEGNALQAEAARLGADYYSTVDELVSFIGELGPQFRERNIKKKDLIASGADEDEQFEQMSKERPWMIVISDLAPFIETVTSKDAAARRLDKALENLIGKGFLHNIYWAAGFNPDDRMRLIGMPLYEAYIRDKCGMHLGGNVAGQQLFEFSGMSFKRQSEPEQPGIALMPPRGGGSYKRVVLPLVK